MKVSSMTPTQAQIDELVKAARGALPMISALARIADPNGNPSGVTNGPTCQRLTAALKPFEQEEGR